MKSMAKNELFYAFIQGVAPIKAGIFPLVKNKPALVEKAQEIYKLMQRRWNVIYDQSGAIGQAIEESMKQAFLTVSQLTSIRLKATVQLR